MGVIEKQDENKTIESIVKPLDDVLSEVVKEYLTSRSENDLYRKLKCEVEKGIFLAALRFAKGNKTRAAQILGVNRKILSEKILKYFDTTVVGKAYQTKPVHKTPEFDELRTDIYTLTIASLKNQPNRPGGLYRYIIDQVESAVMSNLLEKTNGNQTKAAQMMGMGRSVFCQKLKNRTPRT